MFRIRPTPQHHAKRPVCTNEPFAIDRKAPAKAIAGSQKRLRRRFEAFTCRQYCGGCKPFLAGSHQGAGAKMPAGHRQAMSTPASPRFRSAIATVLRGVAGGIQRPNGKVSATFPAVPPTAGSGVTAEVWSNQTKASNCLERQASM